jgi:site-specific DNA recombinase
MSLSASSTALRAEHPIRQVARFRPDVNRKPRRSKRSYAFSGLLFCGLCDRRMIGSFDNGRNHYRCTYSSEYADANRLAHPRSLYLREDKIVELVDPWIRRAFSTANLRTTLQAMADAQHDDADQHRVIAAREKITTCRTKLDRYRAALDAGTDPTLVQQWITQVQAEKAAAEADLRQITGRRTMTADEINTLVEAMSGIASILRQADPTDKAEVYRQLGIKLTYKPGLRSIQAEASPSGSCTKVCPEIDTNRYPT